MMFRIIRRAPWIAVGAGAAYFLDGPSGSARRRDVAERAKAWAQHMREEWLERSGSRRVTSPVTSPWATGGTTFESASGDAPLVPSVPEDRVTARAEAPLAEEQSAGVPDPAREAMAEQILTESERRLTDRAGTGTEHRRSEETVEPVEMITGAG